MRTPIEWPASHLQLRLVQHPNTHPPTHPPPFKSPTAPHPPPSKSISFHLPAINRQSKQFFFLLHQSLESRSCLANLSFTYNWPFFSWSFKRSAGCNDCSRRIVRRSFAYLFLCLFLYQPSSSLLHLTSPSKFFFSFLVASVVLNQSVSL